MKKIILKYTLWIILFIIPFAACNNSGTESETNSENHSEGEAGHEEASSDVIKITETQFKTIGIELSVLSNKNLKNTIKANGLLALPPQREAKVSSLVAGRVKEIYVNQGNKVKKGQKLAIIEHQEVITLQEDFLKTQSTLAYAESEYKRQKELLEEKIIAAKKFQQAEAEYKTQKAQYLSLLKQLQLLGISPSAVSRGNFVNGIVISAPIEGFVNHIFVTTGSFVESNQEMFEVLDNSHIHVDLKVFPKDVANIKIGQHVAFNVSTFPGQEFIAEIFSLGKAFEGKTGAVEVHAEIKNNHNVSLLPGMFVNARIITGNSQTPALPNEAIITEGELKYIFVKTDDEHDEQNEAGHEHKEGEKHDEKEEEHEHSEGEEEHIEKPGMSFKRVEIKTGISDLGYTEIISIDAIPKNAQVVTKGAFYLSAQMKKNQGGGEEDDHGH